jgi:hypothetical protein
MKSLPLSDVHDIVRQGIKERIIMERINVRVEATLKQQLEIEARRKGVSPSAIVREVLEKHFVRQPEPENCLQLAERLGILGIYKDAPHDLSTNPEHMEGFGLD